MTAASAKQRAIELLWIVGAASIAIAVSSMALWFATGLLGLDINDVIESSIAVVAAVGGGAWGLQAIEKRKRP